LIQINITLNGNLLQLESLKDPYLVPLLFLLYVNDLPNAIFDISNPVLYADDTSLIITNSDIKMSEKDINTVILRLNRWFHSNLLLLNLGKIISFNFQLKTLMQQTCTYHMKINKYPVHILQNV
jgi:hypothetical protein